MNDENFFCSPRFDLPLYENKGITGQIICHACGEPGHKITTCPVVQQFKEKQVVCRFIFIFALYLLYMSLFLFVIYKQKYGPATFKRSTFIAGKNGTLLLLCV